jgi:hypothetical protein
MSSPPPQATDAAPAPERRNLYRILHVQPEAPLEVIKASYRALMSSLRAHPDLGGDPGRAAQINAAYAVLRDPLRRAAYDQSLRRPVRPAAGAGPTAPAAAPACPFCRTPVPTGPNAPAGGHCPACEAPLTPAPATDRRVPGEWIGRRRGARVALAVDATLRLPGVARSVPAVLRDVSVTGVSLACLPALATGAVVRVTTATFDALVRVVDCRPAGPAQLVRAEMLTLQVQRPAAPVGDPPAAAAS